MVNDSLTDAAAAERALALSYAPAGTRAGMAALFALDARLRAIARLARDPLIGTMRLTWWREALARLDAAPPPPEPVLRDLAATVLPGGVGGAALARLTDPWERILAGDVDWAAIVAQRAAVFRLAGALSGADDPRVAVVGRGWAAADLARDWPAMGAIAPEALRACYRRAWPRALRPLGALGLLARYDAEGVPPGSPRRVARLLAHRLTGR